jgi:S-adenosylmethionine:tRNA ribosyltransferase-isomerase
LPDERIAKTPADPPDASRLLALEPGGFRELIFRDFPSLLRAGDVLVINETRVIRARLRGERAGGGAAEVLLLRPAGAPRYSPAARRWQALVRPGRRLRTGAHVRFGETCRAVVTGVLPDGVREVELVLDRPFEAFLEAFGELPLPPYVGEGDERRAARYQTIFAKEPGSVAAPTASLHFTPGVFASLRERGVEIVTIVLDVGLGTFKPIETPSIDGHVMHAEYFRIPEPAASAIRAARSQGRRVVAAGTTVLRALEGAYDAFGSVKAGEGDTRIYITPGFRFAVADALLTNFHLPGSSLLALVCAFAGYERTMAAYRFAVEHGYRFYSFGDAMFAQREVS